MSAQATLPVRASATAGWKLGPEHPDYAYSGERGYPVLDRTSAPPRAKRRSQYAGGKRGLIVHRRFVLTPEGEAAVSRADSARSEPAASCAQAAASPSGHPHANCPPSLRWLCDGPLPFGWVKEADRGSQ